jgi:hypothetical protein
MVFETDGTVASSSPPPGPLVKHYTYDALGRLIRSVSPWPAPGVTQLRRSEAYYYDGLRRIQEVRSDPLSGVGDNDTAGLLGIESERQVFAAATVPPPTSPRAPAPLPDPGQCSSCPASCFAARVGPPGPAGARACPHPTGTSPGLPKS